MSSNEVLQPIVTNASTSQLAPSVALRALALETVERVSAILPKGGHLKNDASFKYCRFTAYSFWLRSHVYRSYPHIALQTMQTRTKGLAPLPTRSLSKYGGISARVSQHTT